MAPAPAPTRTHRLTASHSSLRVGRPVPLRGLHTTTTTKKGISLKGSFSVARCIVPGCMKPARTNPWAARSKTGRWCGGHWMRARRHGDPLQTWVQKKTLRSHIKYVQGLLDRDHSGKLERVAVQLYINLKSHVEEVVADLEAGRMVPRWTARGAYVLLQALSESTPIKSACGSYWDQRRNGGKGGAKPVYKELPLRVVQEIGLLLLATYTPFAARVIQHELKERNVGKT